MCIWLSQKFEDKLTGPMIMKVKMTKVLCITINLHLLLCKFHVTDRQLVQEFFRIEKKIHCLPIFLKLSSQTDHSGSAKGTSASARFVLRDDYNAKSFL